MSRWPLVRAKPMHGDHLRFTGLLQTLRCQARPISRRHQEPGRAGRAGIHVLSCPRTTIANSPSSITCSRLNILLHRQRTAKSASAPSSACIRILKEQEMDDAAEESEPRGDLFSPKNRLPVVYNDKISPEFFDFIVIDECHRSIYDLWRQVSGIFRRLPHRTDGHSGQPHLRLLQEERG